MVVGEYLATVLGRHQVLLAELLPAAHRLEDVGRARMRLESGEGHVHGHRAAPRDGHRLAEFPHVGLRAHCRTRPARRRRIEIPPAEVAPRHLLPYDGRLGERILDQLLLEYLRHEAVEGVRPGEHVPAEVRLRRALAEQGLRGEHLPVAVLPVRDVEVAWHVHALGTIQVDVLEPAVV